MRNLNQSNEEDKIMKRVASCLFILMFVFMLMGSATTAFAGPGKDNSKACENASDNGKSNANSNSALGNCDNTSGGSGDDGNSDDNTDSPPAEEPPAEEPPAGECTPATPEFC